MQTLMEIVIVEKVYVRELSKGPQRAALNNDLYISKSLVECCVVYIKCRCVDTTTECVYMHLTHEKYILSSITNKVKKNLLWICLMCIIIDWY